MNNFGVNIRIYPKVSVLAADADDKGYHCGRRPVSRQE